MPTEPPRRMCAPSTICACGSGSAVRLYGHQLYRSPDSRPAFAISQGDLSLDKHRLREPAYRVPDCVFSGPNGVREIYGSRGHPARIEPVRSPVLDSFDRHFSFPRVLQFCDVPVFLGCRRIRQLAGATKAVSEWFPKQERALATAFFDSGSSIGSAIAPFVILPIYFRWGWRAVFVVPGLLGLIWLLVWRSAYHLPREHPRLECGGAAKNPCRRHRSAKCGRTSFSLGRLAETPANLGNDCRKGIYGSGVVLHCGLVSHLPGGKGNLAEKRAHCDLDSVYCSRSREFMGDTAAGT